MAGSSVRNRSDTVTVETPRGPVEVVRQQWRTQQPRGKWRWEWLARRQGPARLAARHDSTRGDPSGGAAARRQAPGVAARGVGSSDAGARALNYARRQQYRRLSRAGTTGVGSVGAVVLALVLASVGAISLAGLLL